MTQSLLQSPVLLTFAQTLPELLQDQRTHHHPHLHFLSGAGEFLLAEQLTIVPSVAPLPPLDILKDHPAPASPRVASL